MPMYWPHLIKGIQQSYDTTLTDNQHVHVYNFQYASDFNTNHRRYIPNCFMITTVEKAVIP